MRLERSGFAVCQGQTDDGCLMVSVLGAAVSRSLPLGNGSGRWLGFPGTEPTLFREQSGLRPIKYAGEDWPSVRSAGGETSGMLCLLWSFLDALRGGPPCSGLRCAVLLPFSRRVEGGGRGQPCGIGQGSGFSQCCSRHKSESSPSWP